MEKSLEQLGNDRDKIYQHYKKFTELCQEAIRVNEKLCRLRPVPEIEDEKELEGLISRAFKDQEKIGHLDQAASGASPPKIFF